MMAEAQDTGALSYAEYAYPRGWHAFVAAVWSAAGINPRDDFATVVDVTSALVWCLSALLALATACLASSLSDRLGMSIRAAGLAGCLAGAATLLPWFLGNYQALGLETSLLGAVVLAVVIRMQLVRPDGVPALLVAGASIALLAHTWQLLLPVVALAALRSGLGVSRRHGPRGLVGAAALAAAVVVVAWPALAAVITVVGVDHATDAGVEVPVPWLVLVLGVSAAVGVSLRLSWSGRWALGLMLVPAGTGLALAAWVGITPDTYYPSKLIWHSAVLLLAPLGVAVVVGVQALRVGGTVERLARVVGGVVAACALLYVIVQPAAAFAGVWSTADGRIAVPVDRDAGSGAGAGRLVGCGRGHRHPDAQLARRREARARPGTHAPGRPHRRGGVCAARRGGGAHGAHGHARGTGSQPLRLLAHRGDPATLRVGRPQEDGPIGRTDGLVAAPCARAVAPPSVAEEAQPPTL